MPIHNSNKLYTATAKYNSGELVDIVIDRGGGRQLPMLGTGGVEREYTALQPLLDQAKLACQDAQRSVDGYFLQSFIPVILGVGTGAGVKLLLEELGKLYGQNFLCIIVDREQPILELGKQQESFLAYPHLVWITEGTSDQVIRQLTTLQNQWNKLPLCAVTHPFYLRLDRNYYAAIEKACRASYQGNFWAKVRYTKFANDKARILLLTSAYFLSGEIIAACTRMGVDYQLITLPEGEYGQAEFVEELLQAVLMFKPDFILTLNHLGVDKEGVLIDLLEQLELPFASWFVDNPHLIVHTYSRLVNPWTVIFTWDKDNIPSMHDIGFSHVYYLPLGVDEHRFSPRKNVNNSLKAWRSDVSFVGNSMVYKVQKRMLAGDFPTSLTANYKAVAAAFSNSHERSVSHFLQQQFPSAFHAYSNLPTTEQRLCYEAMLTWEATLQYRLSCVQGILPFTPLIAGDKGWFDLLPDTQTWRYHPEVSYYDDLPYLYPMSTINFNCTSKQMKGAVNQRVFDVPASGAFLLTDYREQIEDLFIPGKEVVVFHSPDEVTELALRYLHDKTARQNIITAALQRIYAEHTYEHRLKSLIHTMKKIFG